jgi:hypothetical protein
MWSSTTGEQTSGGVQTVHHHGCLVGPSAKRPHKTKVQALKRASTVVPSVGDSPVLN